MVSHDVAVLPPPQATVCPPRTRSPARSWRSQDPRNRPRIRGTCPAVPLLFHLPPCRSTVLGTAETSSNGAPASHDSCRVPCSTTAGTARRIVSFFVPLRPTVGIVARRCCSSAPHRCAFPSVEVATRSAGMNHLQYLTFLSWLYPRPFQLPGRPGTRMGPYGVPRLGNSEWASDATVPREYGVGTLPTAGEAVPRLGLPGETMEHDQFSSASLALPLIPWYG